MITSVVKVCLGRRMRDPSQVAVIKDYALRTRKYLKSKVVFMSASAGESVVRHGFNL